MNFNFIIEEFFNIEVLTVHGNGHPCTCQNVNGKEDLAKYFNEINDHVKNMGR